MRPASSNDQWCRFFSGSSKLGSEFEKLLHEELQPRLRTLSFVIASLYLILVVVHPFAVSPVRVAAGLSAAALVSAFLAAVSGWLLHRSKSVGPHIQCWGLGLSAILTVNSSIHLGLTGDPVQSTNFLLVIIGAAGVLDFPRAWLGCVLLSWGGWFLSGPLQGYHPQWFHFGCLLVMATAVSVFLLSVRIRHREQLELSRREAEAKAVSLAKSNFALQETEWRLNEAQAIAALGSWQYQLDSKELWCSREVHRIFGVTTEGRTLCWEQIQQKLEKTDVVALQEGYHRLVAGAEEFALEISLPVPAGETKLLDVRGHAHLSEEGTLERLSGTIQDVTKQRQQEAERERLEAQLRDAQRMDALGTLAGGIAHDFNNILFSILGNAQLAEMDVPSEHPARQRLDNIVSGCKRARDLVRQILTFSQRQDLSVEEINPSEIAAEVLKLLRASMPPSIDILTNFESDCPPISGDPSQIHQILVNLCSNALDAMRNGGGRLKLSVARVWSNDELRDSFPELESESAVRIRVEDTGEGMDDETVQRVFDPFFTTKASRGGTGLGLSVVHGIVKRHHGAITVSSRLQQGTVFSLYFPVVDEKESLSDSGNEGVKSGEGERILLVDDEEPVLTAVSGLLERLNYRVTECCNPLDAQRLLERFPRRFDLMVTDLRMKEMSGASLAEQAKKIKADLPIVLITGHAENLRMDDLSRIGVTTLLRKPISVEALSHAISDAVSGGRGRQLQDSEEARLHE